MTGLGFLPDMGRKAIDQIRTQVKFLLRDRYSNRKGERLARTLSEGKSTS